MDIAALSIGSSQTKLAQAVRISVMKMAMDTVQGQSDDLSRMLEGSMGVSENSVKPHLGGNLDISI